MEQFNRGIRKIITDYVCINSLGIISKFLELNDSQSSVSDLHLKSYVEYCHVNLIFKDVCFIWLNVDYIKGKTEIVNDPNSIPKHKLINIVNNCPKIIFHHIQFHSTFKDPIDAYNLAYLHHKLCYDKVYLSELNPFGDFNEYIRSILNDEGGLLLLTRIIEWSCNVDGAITLGRIIKAIIARDLKVSFVKVLSLIPDYKYEIYERILYEESIQPTFKIIPSLLVELGYPNKNYEVNELMEMIGGKFPGDYDTIITNTDWSVSVP